MKAILNLIARHKTGEPCGMFSVCSAHPLVIEATFRHAVRSGAPFALIEATSNQVNQDGGYTGMTPAQFRDFVHHIADRVGLERERILLGGDHLGPNAWQARPAGEAMMRADVLIRDYVSAGFRKIHLDCSMPCGDDLTPLANDSIATRAARLCAVAENAYRHAGGEPPVYIIGTEVPIPGGAAEGLDTLAVTTPEAAGATIDRHREIFAAVGLADAWHRVIAVVVQPGVEFDGRKVVNYVPQKALALKAMIEGHGQLVYEAHSTDYQAPSALAALVQDHFAILKVGPGLTFALREALWALDAIEREWIKPGLVSGFRDIAIARMKADPRYWAKYYHSQGAALEHDLQYSLSDRIRYYWPDPEIARAQARMLRNLAESPPSLALISQHLPIAHAAVRDSLISGSPVELVVAQMWSVLDGYQAAVSVARRGHHG